LALGGDRRRSSEQLRVQLKSFTEVTTPKRGRLCDMLKELELSELKQEVQTQQQLVGRAPLALHIRITSTRTRL
jgi:hypothetical protein